MNVVKLVLCAVSAVVAIGFGVKCVESSLSLTHKAAVIDKIDPPGPAVQLDTLPSKSVSEEIADLLGPPMDTWEIAAP